MKSATEELRAATDIAFKAIRSEAASLAPFDPDAAIDLNCLLRIVEEQLRTLRSQVDAPISAAPKPTPRSRPLQPYSDEMLQPRGARR